MLSMIKIHCDANTIAQINLKVIMLIDVTQLKITLSLFICNTSNNWDKESGQGKVTIISMKFHFVEKRLFQNWIVGMVAHR